MGEQPETMIPGTGHDGRAEGEVNILDYWRVIWKRRALILWMVAGTVVATALISLLMANVYQAKAVIMPVTQKESGPAGGLGLTALAQQFSGLPGISLPGSASASEIISLLKSNILREKMIQRYHLLPVLFHKRWDPRRQTWKRSDEIGPGLDPRDYVARIERALAPSRPDATPKGDNDPPSTWDALRRLDDIVRVSQDVKQNTITVSADFSDPETAARVLDYLLVTLTDYMSGEAKRVATTNRKYLEAQLEKTNDPFIKQKTYNLIAQQIETGMMAEVKENFAFKIIDPPLAPDKTIRPRRLQMMMLALLISVLAGIGAAFFREYAEKARNV